MRPSTLALTVLSLFPAVEVPAQPVLTQDDFLSIGDRARRETYLGPVDVTGLTAPGPTGDWDFTASFGESKAIYEIECLPVDEGPVDAARHVPGADRVVEQSLVARDTGLVYWVYHSCDSRGRTLHGYASNDDIRLDVIRTEWSVLLHPVVEFPLPLTLGDEWTYTYQEFDPRRVVNGNLEREMVSSVDAWGVATFPGIGPVECLRVNQEFIMYDSFGRPGFFRVYRWLARGVGEVAMIAKFSFDSFPDPGFTSADELHRFVDFTPAAVAAKFVRGEVNGDGSYDITDPVASLSYQFIGNFQPDCLAALDFDDNGIIDLSDPIASLSHQFLGGAAPAAPFPGCGPDPTTDLPCESFAACP